MNYFRADEFRYIPTTTGPIINPASEIANRVGF